MKKTGCVVVGLWSLLLTMGACTGVEPDADRPSFSNHPIIGGAPATDPHHDAVVSLHYNGSSGIFCSGTLISSDVVLTAGHCLDTARGGPSFRTMSPSLLTVYVGSDPTSTTEPYASNHIDVSETLINPGYDRRRLLNDIALVRLSSPVAGVTPVPGLPLSLGFTSADVGATELDFAGFGYSDTARTEIDVKLHATGPLGGLGCSVAGCPTGYSQYTDTQISYDNAEGPCNGDSGGPAFVSRGGAWYVGGITSYGDSGCEVYGASTRVDGFESFVDAFVNPPPPPACGDGVCNGAEDCSTCESDCGTCPSDPVCGDGVCESGESCEADCGACFPSNTDCSAHSDCCSGRCRDKGRKAGTCS